MNETAKEAIKAGKAVLGIEFGSTRIKAVLVGKEHAPIASGSYATPPLPWELTTGRTVWRTIFGPIAWKTSGKDCRGVTRAWQTMWKQNTVKS